MKICPECKDVIMYCKCAEEYFEEHTEVPDNKILEDLKKYISAAPGMHIAMGKWSELYDMIVYIKPLNECNDDEEISDSKRQMLFMKDNPPPKKDFGGPSINYPGIGRILLLDEQLDYALKIAKMKVVDKFIRNLKDSDWCC